MTSKIDRQLQAGRTALCLAALILLAPAVAFAQSPAPAAPAAAAPAAAAEPSPSHLAAARELVTVSGMSRSFNAAIPQMISKVGQNYAQTRPEIMPDLAVVLKQIQPDFNKDIDQMSDKAAHIYAHLLSEPEIVSTVAFFKSDAGKKYVQAEPLFFNEVINAMQDWHQQIAEELMTKVRAEMKKKGHTL